MLSLSCSEIGTDAEEVDLRLNKWMKKARRWGAILLIDEADVYLEERTAQDFQRSSLVSGKYLSIPAGTLSEITPRSLLKKLGVLPRNSIPHHEPGRRFR